MSQLRPRLRFLSVSFFILLPLVLAQQDAASCTVSCRFVIVPTVGPPGLNGTTGVQGPMGPIGATGQTGAQGAQGVMGPVGVQGDKGDKGDTGATGQTGQTGMQGIQGPKGDTGLQGIQGPKGDKGDTGLQGIQGPKGDTGVFDTSSTLVNPTITGVVGGAPIFRTLVASSDTTGWTNCVGTTDGLGKVTFATGTRVNMADIGSLIRWADGTSSVLIDTPGQASSIGTVDDSTVRTNVPCAVFGPNNAFFTGKQYLSMGSPIFHSTNANRVAFLSLASMALNTKATYLLPPISGADQTTMASDTLVGASTVQTLSNKVFTNIEFVPLAGSTTPIWTELNARDYTDATKSPPTPAQPPTQAKGALTVNSFETVRFKMPVSGHLTGTPATLWIEFTVTRIDNLVTFSAGEVLIYSVGVTRPAASIDIGTATNRLPVRFRPSANMHISTWVIDNGIHVIGRLVAFSDGRLRVDSGNGAFNAIAAGVSVPSGIQSLNGNWHVNSNTYV